MIWWLVTRISLFMKSLACRRDWFFVVRYSVTCMWFMLDICGISMILLIVCLIFRFKISDAEIWIKFLHLKIICEQLAQETTILNLIHAHRKLCKWFQIVAKSWFNFIQISKITVSKMLLCRIVGYAPVTISKYTVRFFIEVQISMLIVHESFICY